MRKKRINHSNKRFVKSLPKISKDDYMESQFPKYDYTNSDMLESALQLVAIAKSIEEKVMENNVEKNKGE